MARIPPGVGPKHSASRRPGRRHRRSVPAQAVARAVPPRRAPASFPAAAIIGVSLDAIDADGFRKFAREALDQFSHAQGRPMPTGPRSPRPSTTCRSIRAPPRLKAAVAQAEQHSAARAVACIISACRPTRRCRRCGCWAMPAWSSARASSWKSRSAPISQAPWR